MTAPAVVALFGPTGVGKTAVALALARLLRERGEAPVAISADALQVYAGLETLTGAASAAERDELEHRLIAFLPVTATFSAGEFAQLAHAEIDDSRAAGRTPIVVGGTGLYLRAALTELDLSPPPPAGLRERIEADLAVRGAAALHADLGTLAPERAARIEPSDRSRIVRSLELHAMGALEGSRSDGDSQLWTADTRVPTQLFGLVMERQALYERIDARVDAMVAAGAADEASAAAAAGASRTARAALGFEELLRADVDAMKRRTRQYSKRQLTWMRKLAGVTMLDVTGREPDDVAAEIAARASVRRTMPLRLIEFPADDSDRARRFWAGLLDEQLAERRAGEGDGWQTRPGSPDAATVGVHERGTGPGDRFSLPYFEVDDIAAALARVEELGGSVVHPGESWAVCRDSEGTPFGLAAR